MTRGSGTVLPEPSASDDDCRHHRSAVPALRCGFFRFPFGDVFLVGKLRGGGRLRGIGQYRPDRNSILGYVYLDVNDNGTPDPTDWAIIGAKVGISLQGSTDVSIVYSKDDGSYTFSGLTAGTYLVTMLTPCTKPGKTTLGVLRDADGNVLPPARPVMASSPTSSWLPAPRA